MCSYVANICNNGLRCICMQVNHSQEMREKPLTPWVIAEESGKVIAVHCDCMAGLGESCTHVASLLFAIESGVHIRDSKGILGYTNWCHMPQYNK